MTNNNGDQVVSSTPAKNQSEPVESQTTAEQPQQQQQQATNVPSNSTTTTAATATVTAPNQNQRPKLKKRKKYVQDVVDIRVPENIETKKRKLFGAISEGTATSTVPIALTADDILTPATPFPTIDPFAAVTADSSNATSSSSSPQKLSSSTVPANTAITNSFSNSSNNNNYFSPLSSPRNQANHNTTLANASSSSTATTSTTTTTTTTSTTNHHPSTPAYHFSSKHVDLTHVIVRSHKALNNSQAQQQQQSGSGIYHHQHSTSSSSDSQSQQHQSQQQPLLSPPSSSSSSLDKPPLLSITDSSGIDQVPVNNNNKNSSESTNHHHHHHHHHDLATCPIDEHLEHSDALLERDDGDNDDDDGHNDDHLWHCNNSNSNVQNVQNPQEENQHETSISSSSSSNNTHMHHHQRTPSLTMVPPLTPTPTTTTIATTTNTSNTALSPSHHSLSSLSSSSNISSNSNSSGNNVSLGKVGIQLVKQINTQYVFEKYKDANIRNPIMSPGSIELHWDRRPERILIVKQVHTTRTDGQFERVVNYLVNEKKVSVYVEPVVYEKLQWPCLQTFPDYLNYRERLLLLQQQSQQQQSQQQGVGNNGEQKSGEEKSEKDGNRGSSSGSASASGGNGSGDGASAIMGNQSSSLLPYQQPGYRNLHKLIDLIICLGGDGTILHTASMFPSAVPPILGFNMGSLGFLTSFDVTRYKEYINHVFNGSVYLSTRMRLTCKIRRSNGTIENLRYQVLNDIVVDRGPSPFLCNLDCYCNNTLITTVQADGLILATPTGSTAYSMSAGGSIVHPNVNCLLLTPICPHSLSFRPIILPDSTILTIKVPTDSRSTAWISFDGKSRQELQRGDAIIVTTSIWPVPLICKTEETSEWFMNLTNIFNWNQRERQKSFDKQEDDDESSGSESESSSSV